MVQLKYAPLPFIGPLAVHHWFVVFDGDECHRWEVWQTKNAGGTCFGHVHRDLKAPDAGVGGGQARLAAEWHGEAAGKIARVLKDVQRYPYCGRYRYWPGPNSNTYVAWVLREAGVRHRLARRAIGKGYLR
jgi:hypothetical protein